MLTQKDAADFFSDTSVYFGTSAGVLCERVEGRWPAAVIVAAGIWATGPPNAVCAFAYSILFETPIHRCVISEEFGEVRKG